jgi:ribosomal protein S3AE
MAKKRKLSLKKRLEKFKKDRWFEIIAPKMFDEKVISHTVAIDEKQLYDRRVEISYRLLGGGLRVSHIKLKFKIKDVKGRKCYTDFDGFEIMREHIKRHLRKGRSLIDSVDYYTTKDGRKIQLTLHILTRKTINTTQKQTIRDMAVKYFEELSKEKILDDLAVDLVHGKYVSGLKEKLTKIVPIYKIEISKMEIIE